MARDSFIFYRSFYEAINELSKENQADTYDAIMQYALNQKEVELAGISKAIFSLVKPQLDANYKRYENGKQKKSKTEAKQKQTISKIRTNVNVNDNVNVNVNDNDNNNASDSCIDGLQKIIDFYNENIGAITPYGLEILKSYAEEMPVDLIIYAMQISVEANKTTIQYIKAILNNWQKANIKTLIDAQKESKKIKKKINYTEREYTADELEELYANINKH